MNVVVRLTNLWRRHRRWVLGVALLAAAAIGVGVIRLARKAPAIPTVEVRQGEFVDYAQFRGETKALKSSELKGPKGVGELQIVKLLPNGAAVKKGDVVVEFDTTRIRQTLDQKRSELRQVDAEIEQARAKARLAEEQDRTNLTKARYDVERARLEASKQEILSEIEGKKNKLALADTEQALREAEQKLKSDQAADAADIAEKEHRRAKALFDLHEAEQQILRLYQDNRLTEVPELTRERNAVWYEETIIPLIEALESKNERTLILCVRNGEAMRDLPEECSVEIPVAVSKKKFKPRAVGNCPRFLKGLLLSVKESERLTIEAARHRSYDYALQALCVNPLVPSLQTARKFLDRVVREESIELH